MHLTVLRCVPWEERSSPTWLRLIKLGSGLEDVDQIFIRIQTIFFGCLNDAEGSGAGFRPIRGVCKQKVLPVNHKRLNAALGKVVVGVQMPIQKIIHNI